MELGPILTSDIARANFRDVLDTAMIGGETVIERRGKQIAVVVNPQKWEAAKQAVQRVKQLELLLLSRKRYIEMKADPASHLVTQEQYEQMLLANGIVA